MHESVLCWVTGSLTADEVAGKTVTEAGAYDVNGSVRPAVEALGPASYTGTDLREGPGVDVVCDAAHLACTVGEADIVVCAEMLEHVADWRSAVAGLVSAVKRGGLLLVTTRSRGFPYHGYPDDFWRYSVEQMAQILDGAGLDIAEAVSDPQAPGVFCKARKPGDWVLPDLDAAWSDIGNLAL